MANALLAEGLKPGDRVILYVGNSVELVVAVAALWKAGALPIPITTWTVGRELAFLVSDAKPFAVLYGPEQLDAVRRAELPEGVMHIMTAPADHAVDLKSLIAAGDDEPLSVLPPEPDDAMIGYTSGTTGNPKGSIMTHSNLITTQLFTSAVTGARERRHLYDHDTDRAPGRHGAAGDLLLPGGDGDRDAEIRPRRRDRADRAASDQHHLPGFRRWRGCCWNGSRRQGCRARACASLRRPVRRFRKR